VFGIGATYNLSRRTNLYAGYAFSDADGTLKSDTFDRAQFALGMRHLF
jgi:predicted porin